MDANYDYLHWSTDSHTSQRLCSPHEQLLYTNAVQKVNKRNSTQSRFLVLTNAFIYNFKKATFGGLKRLWAIPQSKLEAVALSFEQGHFVLMFGEGEKCDYLYVANALEVVEVLRTLSPPLVVVKTDVESLQGFRRRKGERRRFDLEVFRRLPGERTQPETGQAGMIYAVQGGVSASELMRYTKVSKRENSLGETIIKLHHWPKYLYFQTVPKTYMPLDALLKANEARHQFGPLQYILSSPSHFSLYYEYRLNSDVLRLLSPMKPADRSQFIRQTAYSLTVQLDKLHKSGQVYGPWTPLHLQVSTDLTVTLVPPELDPLALSIAVNGVEYAEYMAPEVIVSGEYWESSDWWSLGVVLWEMMLRKQPFVDSPDLVEAIVTANGVNIPEEYRDMRSLLGRLVKSDQRTALSGMEVLQDHFLKE